MHLILFYFTIGIYSLLTLQFDIIVKICAKIYNKIYITKFLVQIFILSKDFLRILKDFLRIGRNDHVFHSVKYFGIKIVNS